MDTKTIINTVKDLENVIIVACKCKTDDIKILLDPVIEETKAKLVLAINMM